MESMANILIVHAHHEPQSFSSALARTARETLTEAGHEVVFTDLYAMGFNPVSDRRNFTTAANPAYLKQQQEEKYATEHQGFSAEVEAEIRKLEKSDFLLFSFPLWWFGLPAILKGWVDRTFAYNRVYGGGKWYENGIGRGKRAMAVLTTGGPAESYDGHGTHPPLETILTPVHHGIFWFNGYSPLPPLPPFVAWSAAHGSDEDRRRTLEAWRQRLSGIFNEPPIQLPPTTDFDSTTLRDLVPRFLATITRRSPADDTYRQLIPAETARLRELRRAGKLLSAHFTSADTSPWQAFLVFRDQSAAAVLALCRALPLAAYLDFTVTPLA